MEMTTLERTLSLQQHHCKSYQDREAAKKKAAKLKLQMLKRTLDA